MTACLILFITQASGAAATSSTRSVDSAAPVPTGAGFTEIRAGRNHPVACPGARKGLRWYRSRFNDWRELQGLDTTWPVGRKPTGCADARRLANIWRYRARTAKFAYERWARDEYHWQRWLPRLWYAIGMCETHLDWHFDSGTYVSAFGIIRSAFPGWNGNNSPREQYRVALGIAGRYGLDAWGCWSHGGYRYHLR